MPKKSWLGCVLVSFVLACGGSSDKPAGDAGSNAGMDASDSPPTDDGGTDASSSASDAATGQDSALDEDASSAPCECNDDIECTLDTCDAGVCAHTSQPALCGPSEYCSPETGCVELPACTSDADCSDDRSCVEGSCTCDSPTVVCGSGQCIDLAVDEANCGECGRECLAGQVCAGGECDCPDGQDVCDGSCADLQTDELHCGDCETSCGEGAECAGGACQCASPSMDCGIGEALDCRDITSEAYNCGGCGVQCLDGSKCESSSCEATVTWIKLFGSPGGSTDVYNHRFPLVRGPAGEIYAGLEMNAGDHRLINGGGTTPLWTSARGIVKLDASGNFVWHVASTREVAAIALSGGELWAAGYSSTNVTVAGTTFEVPASASGVTWLVRLDPDDGSVLGSRKLEYPNFNNLPPALVVDSSDAIWLLHTAQLGFTEGLTTWLPVSNQRASFLFRLSDNELRWLPGFLPRHQVDPLGNLVVVIGNPPDEDFTFGGDTLNEGLHAHYAVARFAPDLTHLNSFLTPAQGALGVTATGMLLIDRFEEPFITRFGYTGISGTVDLEIGDEVPLHARSSITAGGRVFVVGRTVSGTYDGRGLGGNRAFVAAYDEETLALESFAGVFPNTGASGAYVTGIAVDATGTEVTISLAFSDYVTVGDVTIDSGNQAIGMAMIRLHMP